MVSSDDQVTTACAAHLAITIISSQDKPNWPRQCRNSRLDAIAANREQLKLKNATLALALICLLAARVPPTNLTPLEQVLFVLVMALFVDELSR